MKVVVTAAAFVDLDQILTYTGEHYPYLVERVERRIRSVITRIGEWPNMARTLEGRPDIRVVPLVRYPYRIFYRIEDERVEILHIHHTARNSL